MSVQGGKAWKQMVLSSLPPVEWVQNLGRNREVVLSSRVRIMRNLRTHHFPQTASNHELELIRNKILKANELASDPLHLFTGMTLAERNYFVACRLISPQFAWQRDGRALFLDTKRSLSLMVNEEDHIRMQAVIGGWSISEAKKLAENKLEGLARNLQFAHMSEFGYLAASPLNCGEGRRLSAMVHLVGLAHTKRLPQLLKALSAQGISARGLFGEGSRAIGAFAQISAISGSLSQFIGACEYLIGQETQARESCSLSEVKSQWQTACNLALSQRSISLANALRIMSWTRFAASLNITSSSIGLRETDLMLTRLELTDGDTIDDQESRVLDLRKFLGL